MARSFNSSGFSIVGVMVAVALSGAVLFSLYGAIAQVASAQRTIKNNLTAQNFRDLISASLASPTYCSKSFENLDLAELEKGQPISIDLKLRDLNTDLSLGSVKFQSGTEVAPGLFLDNFQLQTSLSLGSDKYIGELTIVYKDSVKSFANVITQEVPISFSLSAGRMSSCQSGGGAGGPESGSDSNDNHVKDGTYGYCETKRVNPGGYNAALGFRVSSDGSNYKHLNRYEEDSVSVARGPFDKCDVVKRVETIGQYSKAHFDFLVQCRSGYRKVVQSKDAFGNYTIYNCMKE